MFIFSIPVGLFVVVIESNAPVPAGISVNSDRTLTGYLTASLDSNQISGSGTLFESELKVGDNIQIKGSTTDFTVKVESIQLEHKSIEVAKSGDDIGIKVDQKARRGDKVYLIQND